MNATIAHLPRSEQVYELALEGLSRVNEWMYRNGRLPSIYNGKVRYRREAGETWRHAADVIGSGWGDCEDLAAARVGELRSQGEAGARVAVVRTGPRMTHAVVKRANGAIEDPSARLGMRGDDMSGRFTRKRKKPTTRSRPVERQRIDVTGPTVASASPTSTANAAASFAGPRMDSQYRGPASAQAPSVPREEYAPDPGFFPAGMETDAYGQGDYEMPNEPMEEDDYDQIGADVSQSCDISWTVQRTPDGWKGVVRVPLDAGRCLLVSRTGATKESAGKKALSAASGVLDSPLAKALIPPQAQMALNVIRSPQAQKAAKIALDAAKKLKFW